MIKFTGCNLGSLSADFSSVCPLKLGTGSQQLGASSNWLWLGCLQETAVWWGCGWLCTWPVTGPGIASHCSYPQSLQHDTAPTCNGEKQQLEKIFSSTIEKKPKWLLLFCNLSYRIVLYYIIFLYWSLYNILFFHIHPNMLSIFLLLFCAAFSTLPA